MAIESLIVDEVTAEHAFGRSDSVVIQLWRATLTAERLAKARKHNERCKAQLGRFAVVTMFATDDGEFGADISDEARRGVADLVRWSEGVVTAAVGVVEGTGFLTAMIRAAGSGVAMVARATYPLKIVSTVPDGAAWLSSTLRWPEGASARLVRDIEALRQRSLAIG